MSHISWKVAYASLARTCVSSAQLIKVDDGFNLWSKSFNRELTDIFAVQDEIAGAVLAALKPNVVAEAPKVTASDR